jgi:hypothetical protein
MHMRFVATLLLLACCTVTGTASAQAMPYMDADNHNEAVGMMRSTIHGSAIVRERCVSRFPELAGKIDADLSTWRERDGSLIDYVEAQWTIGTRAYPQQSRQVDEMLGKQIRLALDTIDQPSAPQLLRQYCMDYFQGLASDVWRQRTPRAYGYLEAAMKAN